MIAFVFSFIVKADSVSDFFNQALTLIEAPALSVSKALVDFHSVSLSRVIIVIPLVSVFTAQLGQVS
jgi:hypothetical protein